MFASADMPLHVEDGTINASCREELRRDISNTEDVIFAEQFGMNTEDLYSTVYQPMVTYLNNRLSARVT
eukprot:12325368-Alexandrium_andersonii.AAC.1